MISLPLNRLSHPRELIRNFTPNWFTATMGTGIVALALAHFPFAIPGVYAVGESLWFINIGLFVLCTLLYAARWIFFYSGAKRIFQHSVMGMFFGAIPMGLATILNGFLVFGTAHWGQSAITIATQLWWLDAVLALLCAWVIPFLMFTRQDHTLQNMTAIWLLPIVAAEVTAASGGLLLGYLHAGPDATAILFLSYVLWGTSVLPAMGILVILFLRMALHKLPGRDTAVSSWLSIGPIGTGALALLQLGEQAPHILVAPVFAGIGQFASAAGIIGACILWGYGLWWLVIAVLTTVRYMRQGLPFNMGWWAFTFPIGVYSLATLALARITGVEIFAILGAVFVCVLLGFWLIVTGRTLVGIYHGHLFVAPCLSNGTGLQLPVATQREQDVELSSVN
jgi:C4-dicarboxylate transporter/malic acid transport protein